MEVHHHAHTQRKKWTHYLWEFLMLFLAVFCGFLAEYQLEHFIEKQRAKDFAFSLHRDLAADTSIFSMNIERLNISSKKIDSLVSLLGNPEKVQDNTALIYYFSAYAFIYPSSTPNESTLQQLLNSGSLRYFKDPLLVDSIKYYSTRIQLFRDFEQSAANLNIEFRKNQLQVIDINPVIAFMEAGQLFSNSEIHFTDLTIFNNRQLFTNNLSRLKEYANWCGLKKFYLTNSIYRYGGLKQQAASLLQLIDKTYHIK